MGSVTSAFTKSRNTLVKVGSEPQKEPDGKTRSGSGVIAKQTSKQPLARRTTGSRRANTPQTPASATGEFLYASVASGLKHTKLKLLVLFMYSSPKSTIWSLLTLHITVNAKISNQNQITSFQKSQEFAVNFRVM